MNKTLDNLLTLAHLGSVAGLVIFSFKACAKQHETAKKLDEANLLLIQSESLNKMHMVVAEFQEDIIKDLRKELNELKTKEED